MNETDELLVFLRGLVESPHGNLDQIREAHLRMLNAYPEAYAHFAAWAMDHISMRDQQMMFIACLCTSRVAAQARDEADRAVLIEIQEAHRRYGSRMLRRLPPRMVAGVIDYLKGTTATLTVSDGQGSPLWGTRAAGKQLRRQRTHLRFSEQTVPHPVRTAVRDYLREREADAAWFDRIVLNNREDLERLYRRLHIRPGPRAQQILFERQIPEDSLLGVLMALRAASTPVEQAKLISTHRVPYRVATSALREMAPTVIAALVDGMSDTELINNLASLKRRGALDNPEIRALIESRLERAAGSTKGTGMKTRLAAEKAGLTGAVAEKLDLIAQARARAHGRIRGQIVVAVDKSTSRRTSIDVSQVVTAMLATICDPDQLLLLAYDSMVLPVPIERLPRDQDGGLALRDLERAMAAIRPIGKTSPGALITYLRERRIYPDRLIIISDGDENTSPSFEVAMRAYMAERPLPPRITLILVGDPSEKLEKAATALGVPLERIQFTGDYYALGDMVALVSRPSLQDLLLEVLAYPLPEEPAGGAAERQEVDDAVGG